MQFKSRLSAVLQIFLSVGGRLRLSYGRWREVYVLIAVNRVFYVVFAVYFRFSAALCGSTNAEDCGMNRRSVKMVSKTEIRSYCHSDAVLECGELGIDITMVKERVMF